MLTVIMEAYKGGPHTSTKMSPSLQNTIPAQGAKKKTPLISRSDDLQSIYLQQFKQYPLPLVPLPLKTPSQVCQLPQPLPPKYNPVLLLEEQVCQEEEVPQAEEEALLVEEEAHQEEEEVEETPCNPPLAMENPWACCPPYLKGIALKLRAFSENSPLTSSLTMTSQHSPHLSKESLLPSLASKDQRSIDGPSSNSNG